MLITSRYCVYNFRATSSSSEASGIVWSSSCNRHQDGYINIPTSILLLFVKWTKQTGNRIVEAFETVERYWRGAINQYDEFRFVLMENWKFDLCFIMTIVQYVELKKTQNVDVEGKWHRDLIKVQVNWVNSFGFSKDAYKDNINLNYAYNPVSTVFKCKTGNYKLCLAPNIWVVERFISNGIEPKHQRGTNRQAFRRSRSELCEGKLITRFPEINIDLCRR